MWKSLLLVGIYGTSEFRRFVSFDDNSKCQKWTVLPPSCVCAEEFSRENSNDLICPSESPKSKRSCCTYSKVTMVSHFSSLPKVEPTIIPPMSILFKGIKVMETTDFARYKVPFKTKQGASCIFFLVRLNFTKRAYVLYLDSILTNKYLLLLRS